MPPVSGRDFENEIRGFLNAVGFDNVPRPNERLLIGRQEVDAFGRNGDLYVVVDAKTRARLDSRRRGRNVRSYLSIMNGYMDEVIRGIRERYEEPHGYRGTIFVFWTKNVKTDREHQERAKDLGIALRDAFDLKNYLEGYEILANQEIVRNSFLKDLSLQLNDTLDFQIFASGHTLSPKSIRTRFGTKTLYTFPIEVRDLLKFAYVFRIELNSILGGSYQRLLKGRKVRSIRSYVRGESGYFPNNLIAISEQPLEDSFIPERGQRADASFVIGELRLPDKPCYLEILDGQHRLYGYSNLLSRQNDCLWVTIVDGLSPVERAKLFVKINKTQTPVPSDILWDLYQITEPQSIRGRISKFVYELNEEQPFNGLISLPRIRSLGAYLSFSNFCYSLWTRSGLFSQFGTHDNFMSVIEAFFTKVRDNLVIGVDWARSVRGKGKKGFVLTNNSISVLLRLLAKILSRTGIPDNDRVLSWKNQLDNWIISSIIVYLRGNTGSDVSDPHQALRRDLTSEAARKDAALEIWGMSPLSNPSFTANY